MTQEGSAQCIDAVTWSLPTGHWSLSQVAFLYSGCLLSIRGHPCWAELTVYVTPDVLSQLKTNSYPSGVDLGDGGKEIKCKLH